MKFLTPLDNDDVLSVIDVMVMSMLFYNGVKQKHILKDPNVIGRLSVAAVAVASQNVHIKNLKDEATMGISAEDLVRKVKRNGKTFGVIQGGRG